MLTQNNLFPYSSIPAANIGSHFPSILNLSSYLSREKLTLLPAVCCLIIIRLLSVSVGHRAPPARSGHRCVADNTNLYVFGGYNPDYDESGGSENEDYPLFRELWRFHFATGTWQQIRTEGFMPTELASMSGNMKMVFLLFLIFVLRMCREATGKSGMLNLFPLLTILFVRHTAVLHGNNLLVFGGTGIPFGENNGNDVHVCNVKYKRWSLLNCRGKKPNRIYGQVQKPNMINLLMKTSTRFPVFSSKHTILC